MNINKIGETLVSRPEFSGVIQITAGDKIKLHIASGFANRSELIRNELDTKFGIASGTKGFTAVAVMKLVEQGKLSLSDDVFKILPMKFPNMKNKVTVRHLLNHTSGIYDYFDEDVDEDFTEMFEKVPLYSINGPQDMMPLLIDGDCYFKPGEQFKYCNSGFVILAILIEFVSGKTYAEFLDDEIMKPYGLNNTGCYKTNSLPKNTALGYEQCEDDSWCSNIFSIPKSCTGDGGLMTTSMNLARMWKKLIAGEILNKELTEELLKEQSVMDERTGYGLGFYRQYDDNHELKNYYLVGEDPGVSFFSGYYVKDDVVLTIISNTEEGAWDLLDEINDYID